MVKPHLKMYRNPEKSCKRVDEYTPDTEQATTAGHVPR